MFNDQQQSADLTVCVSRWNAELVRFTRFRHAVNPRCMATVVLSNGRSFNINGRDTERERERERKRERPEKRQPPRCLRVRRLASIVLGVYRLTGLKKLQIYTTRRNHPYELPYYHYSWSRCSFVKRSIYDFNWRRPMVLCHNASNWYIVSVLTT